MSERRPPSRTELTLTTDAHEIKSMVVRLMGRGNRSRTGEVGAFIVSLDDLMDLHAQITQRINSQNEAQLVDFYCKFLFEGGSEELVPSEETFKSFRYLGSKTCGYVELNYTFLIKFPGRALEKQQISVELAVTNAQINPKSMIDRWTLTYSETGVMSMLLEHTDYTGAEDLKNLFDRYTKSKLRTHKISQWATKVLSSGAPISELMLGFLFSSYLMWTLAEGIMGESRQDRLSVVGGSAPTIQSVSDRLNYMLEHSSSGGLWTIMAYPAGFLLVVIAFALLRRAASALHPRTYIVLNEHHQIEMRRRENSLLRRSLILLSGVTGTVILGIASTRLNEVLSIVGI